MIRHAATGLLILALLGCTGAEAGEPGTSGFIFLRLGSGARAAGMGEAFTSVADDATSMYYNPAGMTAVEGVDLNVTHSEWLLDIRFEQVSVVNEMLGGAVGMSFTGVYYGEMDRYGDYPSITPDGTFAPYDLSIAGGYARDILPNLSAGASVKLIYEKIDFESATGWAVDLGILHKSKIEGLTLAASLLNYGPQAKFVEERFYPPFQARLGGSYLYDREWMKGRLIVAGDAVFPNDNDTKIHLGAEYLYGDLFAVRFGYKANYYVQGATLGAGFFFKKLRIDYAFMPMEYEMGDSHRISLSVTGSGL